MIRRLLGFVLPVFVAAASAQNPGANSGGLTSVKEVDRKFLATLGQQGAGETPVSQEEMAAFVAPASVVVEPGVAPGETSEPASQAASAAPVITELPAAGAVPSATNLAGKSPAPAKLRQTARVSTGGHPVAARSADKKPTNKRKIAAEKTRLEKVGERSVRRAIPVESQLVAVTARDNHRVRAPLKPFQTPSRMIRVVRITTTTVSTHTERSDDDDNDEDEEDD